MGQQGTPPFRVVSKKCGEPDIAIRDAGDEQVTVELRGVDISHPQSGEVRSSGPDDIACWFIDTDYKGKASSSATLTSWA
jgi:hypothetical protein